MQQNHLAADVCAPSDLPGCNLFQGVSTPGKGKEWGGRGLGMKRRMEDGHVHAYYEQITKLDC